MRSVLILNPRSGDDRAPEWRETIARTLRDGGDALEILETAHEGHAGALAREAAAAGVGRIYVGGGDGTLNEIVNGAAQVPGALERLTFGVLPLGTGNDFARALGLGDDLEAALPILAERQTIEVDLGVLNDRLFVNVSGGGFLAEVSDTVSPGLKTIAGRLAYIVGGAQVLWQHEPMRAAVTDVRSPRVLDASGQWEPGLPPRLHAPLTIHAFAVCNAPMIGGGRLIAPHAEIDDGAFDLCLIEEMPRLEFVALLARVSSGDHVDDPRVTYLRAEAAELRFDRTVKVNTDGEVLEAQRCRYAIRRRAARFFAAASRDTAPVLERAAGTA